MSNIAMQGGATGTGTVTLLAPVTNTNRTINLPDSNGTVATAESTLTQFNASGSAPVYACRAWVNFNGSGTPAIRASGNVSSITDRGTGLYTANFTTAPPDANYSVCAMAGDTGGGGTFDNAVVVTSDQTTSGVAIITRNVQSAGAVIEPNFIAIAVFR